MSTILPYKQPPQCRGAAVWRRGDKPFSSLSAKMIRFEQAVSMYQRCIKMRVKGDLNPINHSDLFFLHVYKLVDSILHSLPFYRNSRIS